MLPNVLRWDSKEKDNTCIVLLLQSYFPSNFLFAKTIEFQIKHYAAEQRRIYPIRRSF